MVTKKVLCKVTCLFLLLAPHLHAQKLNLKTYGPEDGLPQAQVISALQDSRGYLWFGTFSGACRFSGHRFDVFDTTTGLISNVVWDIAEDAAGNVYFATLGGGVTVYDGHNYKHITEADLLRNNYVNDILIEADGRMWLATNGALTCIEDGKAVHYDESKGLACFVCNCIYRDREGVLWLGSEVGLFYLTDSGVFAKRDFGLELAGTEVKVIIEGADGVMWVGTGSGLLKLEGGGFRQIDLGGGVGHPIVTSATLHSDGAIWFGSFDGVFCYSSGRFTRYDSKNGLCDNRVNRILSDREGNIWLMTDSGVSRLRNGPFVFFTTDEGLTDSNVIDMKEDSEGRLWLATSSGVTLFDGEGFAAFPANARLPSRYINALALGADGRMYIGTYNSLCSWDGRALNVLSRDFGVSTLMADSKGRIWVGSSRGPHYWEGGRLLQPTDKEPLAGAYINCMAEDSLGRIWFGTSGLGCLVWDGRDCLVFDDTNGLSKQDIWTLVPDGKGGLWIGTNGDGAFHFDGAKFSRYTTARGLTNNYVWQILPDSKGHVWFGTNKGIDRFDGESMMHFDTNDGLPYEEGNADACMQDSAGRIWFCYSNGLSMLVAPPSAGDVATFPLYVEQVLCNGERIAGLAGMVFDSDQRNFQFEYAGLYYSNESAVRFGYMLEGLDTDWSEPTSDHNVRYANLPPGDYDFTVRASIDNGRTWIAASKGLTFIIRPPFYATPWFVALAAALILALIYLAHSFRVGRIEREKSILEQKVSDRTAELVEANQQLTRTNEGLATLNKEMEAFSYTVSHDLRSPINRIQAYLLMLGEDIKGLKFEGVSDILEKINSNCRKMKGFIDALLRLSRASQMKITCQGVDLGPIAREAAAGLLERQPDRNIRFEISDTIAVRGDAALLSIAVQNLLENAWKCTRNTAVAVIEVGIIEGAGERVIFVRDNGIGFPAEKAAELFAPFQQLHDEPDLRGIGLGLATVRRIVQRHGGRIWAEGEQGVGAAFFFTLAEV